MIVDLDRDGLDGYRSAYRAPDDFDAFWGETLAAVEIAETEKAAEPQAGQITGPRRRGWKISTPRYME